MDMNKSFVLKNEERNPGWRKIDASGQVLGRLCTQIADMLRGKDKPTYTPHTDSGDYIVVMNCEKIVLTGNKWDDKIYAHHTGWRSGYKEQTAKALFKKDPCQLISIAVKGMLPKNKLNRQIIKKLKLYVGDVHPHKAQLQD